MMERANQKRPAASARAVTYRGRTTRPADFDPAEFAKRIVAGRAPKRSVDERASEMESKFARRR